MKYIAVFCGASEGSTPEFRELAFELGKYLVSKNYGLVYGGARVGLMGAVADGVIKNGGKSIGIIPKFLSAKEIVHTELTELIIVDNMHERKLLMHEKCDGIIALPGGFGTMEELFEVLTWAQLGLHTKPIGILNCLGFYDDLLRCIQQMVDKKFLKEVNQQMLLVDKDFKVLLKKMEAYVFPQVPKWISRETT